MPASKTVSLSCTPVRWVAISSCHGGALRSQLLLPVQSPFNDSPVLLLTCLRPDRHQVLMAGVLLDVMRQANEDAGGLIPYSGQLGEKWGLCIKPSVPGAGTKG